MVRFALIAFLAGCSACTAPAVNYPINDQAIANSVFKISDDEGSGTAWVIKNEDTGSYLITAGHVCGAGHYTLEAQDGTEYHAYDVMGSVDPDLCEVYSPATVGYPLPVATEMPPYGAEMTLVGAPSGVWGDGIAPIFTVRYSGMNIYGGPVAPGDSGGPVTYEGEVVGVLVRGASQINIGVMEPEQSIHNFMDVK